MLYARQEVEGENEKMEKQKQQDHATGNTECETKIQSSERAHQWLSCISKALSRYS